MTRDSLVFSKISKRPSTREEYVLQLAADKTTLLAVSIEKFVGSTLESNETDPLVVMSNVRQFMSGMTNYLVIDDEKKFKKLAKKECRQSKSTEFLNLDVVLNNVMNRLVLKELRDHIYSLLVDEYVANGSIQSMVENIHYAKSTSIQDFNARKTLIPPKENDLKQILECFKCLQVAFLPSEKLKHLLSAVTLIHDSVKVKMRYRKMNVCIGGDDFLPLMAWVLVQCKFYSAELEVKYMDKFLLPSQTISEGGYYLTTLEGAVHVLKNYKPSMEAKSEKMIFNFPDTLSYDPLNELESVLKVVIPDKTNGSVLTKTLPVRPQTTARDVCIMIAQKLHLTNQEDYYLFTLIDRKERLLLETEHPQNIKSSTTARGSYCLFVCKRIDEK